MKPEVIYDGIRNIEVEVPKPSEIVRLLLQAGILSSQWKSSATVCSRERFAVYAGTVSEARLKVLEAKLDAIMKHLDIEIEAMNEYRVREQVSPAAQQIAGESEWEKPDSIRGTCEIWQEDGGYRIWLHVPSIAALMVGDISSKATITVKSFSSSLTADGHLSLAVTPYR